MMYHLTGHQSRDEFNEPCSVSESKSGETNNLYAYGDNLQETPSVERVITKHCRADYVKGIAFIDI
jgi:hypothetical protein